MSSAMSIMSCVGSVGHFPVASDTVQQRAGGHPDYHSQDKIERYTAKYNLY
jgi:hypothetical protein